MRSFYFVLMAVCLSGCAKEITEMRTVSNNCSVKETETGVAINCPDGTSAVLLNGKNGEDGADGEDGTSGSSCSVEEAPHGYTITCTDGTSVYVNTKKNKCK